jgi:hypothetical protein
VGDVEGTAVSLATHRAPAFIPAPTSPRLLGAVWTLLVINTMGSQGADTIVPIPKPVAQIVTMGAIAAAFLLALMLNPRIQLRPSAYLLLMTFLLVVSIASSARLESGYGALFRCFRFALFVATLWLVTRWWDDWLSLMRHHVRAFAGVLLTVVAGLAVAPGLARPDVYGGRLVGAVWPLTPPQVGFYAASLTGLVIMMWLGRLIPRSNMAVLTIAGVTLLLMSHTRTALIGLIGGLVVGLLAMASTSSLARKVFTRTAIVVGIGAVLVGPFVEEWFKRGQDDLSNLTGREKVWDALLAAPRTVTEQWMGVGLTNKSFNGLPIDSSWLTIYHEQGYLGLALVAGFLVTLIVVAALRPPSIQRAIALFLIFYCIIASYTEAGLGDAAPYLLNLALAAALLIQPRTEET